MSGDLINVLDHGSVELRKVCAEDRDVLEAMLVSTGQDVIWGTEVGYDLATSHTFGLNATNPDADVENKAVARNKGRINYLMKNRHGTPFEQNMFKFRVTAPIFVFREWHRHRIGWSYNEQSGRYMELGDKWYLPEPENVRQRVGKPGHYTYERGGKVMSLSFVETLNETCQRSYDAYKLELKHGIAPELARLHLHVNHYSSMYATCNARSLMAFLSLRNHPTAQWEIQQYANALEHFFAEAMPVTYECFVTNGRVAP